MCSTIIEQRYNRNGSIIVQKDMIKSMYIHITLFSFLSARENITIPIDWID